MKDHEIAKLVNEITSTAMLFHDTQQLRSRIADVVLRHLKTVMPTCDTCRHALWFDTDKKWHCLVCEMNLKGENNECN